MKIESKLLLTPPMFKPTFGGWEIHGVLNPGGVRRKDKKILLYVRLTEAPKNKEKDSIKCPVIISEKEYKATSNKIPTAKIKGKQGNLIYLRDGSCRLLDISHFRQVILSESGFAVEEIDQDPRFTGHPKTSNYGVEDPRIAKIGNTYYMTYVTVSSRDGVSTSLASSKDLENWTRLGLIFQEQNKDVVLFPEKINGKYVALNRPESSFFFSKPSIWISYSPDLIYWGKETAILRARENSWETIRNGAGPPPIRTKKGWLLIYHGVNHDAGKNTYSAGAALLDLKNPEKVLARTPAKKPLIYPSQIYEKSGFMNNVVFPTTIIPTLDNKELLIYSGGADSVITVKKISFNDIFESLEYN